MQNQLQASFNDKELERILKICKQEFVRKAGFVYTAVMKYLEELEKNNLD